MFTECLPGMVHGTGNTEKQNRVGSYFHGAYTGSRKIGNKHAYKEIILGVNKSYEKDKIG